jgi:uncharacterized protein involved in type VI secretion and phage assembly
MPTPSFKLTVDGLELTLVEFDGYEAMNRLFKYTFTAEIPSSGKKLVDMIDGDAVFTINKYDSSIYDEDIEIQGYISKASKSDGYWLLDFEPNLRKEEASSYSKIFYNESTAQTPQEILQDRFDNLTTSLNYPAVFNLLETLPVRNLYCQFGESNLNFIGRLCDHWGISFFFDHINSKLIFENQTSGSGHYLDIFDNQLKTTSSTADNSKFKIKKWSENIHPVNSYNRITGHDYNNAGTSIEASYPADTSNRTEILEIVQDVVSQEEADYLAQAKHESLTALSHTVTGESKIPYIFPGTEISTDDSDFAKVAIVEIKSKGRNLNSTNTGNSASYICEFVGIPDDVSFRPLAFYPVAKATSVIGTIISETDDQRLAQRNAQGEYKAEIIGFDTNSATAPWLRKAQPTAATNSLDIPLTPNTEVLISFIDNNPNCPYIEHALDNSLHPVPVTSANPHHAILQTDGMLVKSSLEGRFDYAVTPRTQDSGNTYATVDTDISGSVKNYLAERGRFDQNSNFIDPSSSTAVDFSDADQSSGDYLFSRFSGDTVEIKQGDKLHWHNGNIYDFGGYWNYNLGNSYEENYLNQAASINTIASPFSDADISSTDLLHTGGPDFKYVDWSSLNISDKVDFTKADKQYPFPGGDPYLTLTTPDSAITDEEKGKPFYKDNLNTSKTFNTNSYEFTTECNSIEISDRCNKLEITHTDGDTRSVELGFHKGNLRSWEETHGRDSESKSWNSDGKKTSEASSSFDSSTNTKTEKETKWDIKGEDKISDSKTTTTPDSVTTDVKTYNMDTGALAAHNIKTDNGMGSAEMDFSFDASAASKFNFGASTSFSLSAQADASLAISLSGNASIALEAGLNLDIKLSGGMTFEMKKDAGGLYKFKNGKFVAETEATILAATTAATIKAMGPTIEAMSATIVNSNAKLEKSIARLSNNQINLQNDVMHLIF